jgi:outer membrane protein OmpA-like peptidoglycan-associated protein
MMPIHRLGGLLLTVMIAGCAVAPPAPAPVSPAVEERQRPVAAAAEPVHSPSEVQVMAAVDNENNVFFVLGSSGINAVGRKKVQDHARRLKADPKLEVTLVGYTDDLR